MKYISNWLKNNKENKPIMATLFTVTIHHLFKIPTKYTPPTFPSHITNEYKK